MQSLSNFSKEPRVSTERANASPSRAVPQNDVVLFVNPEEINTIWLDISTLIGKVKAAHKKREDPVAIFSMLDKESRKELWKVIKDYSDLVSLDNVLRPLLRENIPKLPERILFQSHAPSQVDARKVGLEAYFSNVLKLPNLPYAAARALCEFVSTDMIDPMDIPDSPSRREGYLTKRGKKIRGWKVRFFIIENENLNYYDKPGGELQGSICLVGAKLGRQTPKDALDFKLNDEPMEKEFRHAFLLLEAKKKDYSRHVLCAESDEDRDLWIKVLMEVVDLVTPANIVPPSLDIQGSPKKAVPSAPFSPLDDCAKDNSGRIFVIPPPHHQTHHSISSIASAASSSWTKNKSLNDGSASSQDLKPARSVEESEETPKDKKKKKGFFSSFRSRNNNTSGSHPGNIVASSADNSFDEFRATPYSAVEQKVLPSTRDLDSDHTNPISDMSLYELGVSLEQAIKSQPDTSTGASETSLARSGLSDSTESGPPTRRVFGIPLAEAVSLASKDVYRCKVPAVVYRCIEHLKRRDAILEEGIFRLSGSASTIRGLKERFDREYDVDLIGCETYYDVHAVAGLLKLYLREIPTLILTPYLAPEFREAVEIADPITKTLKLKALVQELPRENRELLCVLCSLLKEVIVHHKINKMTLRNVGIVFAPTLNISAFVLIHFLSEFDVIFSDLDSFEGPGAEVEVENSESDYDNEPELTEIFDTTRMALETEAASGQEEAAKVEE